MTIQLVLPMSMPYMDKFMRRQLSFFSLKLFIFNVIINFLGRSVSWTRLFL